MRELERKRTHDDLPAVHQPVKAAGKSGRDNPAKTAAMDQAELQRLAARLRVAHAGPERDALLAAIEHRFGGGAVARIVAEVGQHDAGAGEPGHSPDHKGPA